MYGFNVPGCSRSRASRPPREGELRGFGVGVVGLAVNVVLADQQGKRGTKGFCVASPDYQTINCSLTAAIHSSSNDNNNDDEKLLHNLKGNVYGDSIERGTCYFLFKTLDNDFNSVQH